VKWSDAERPAAEFREGTLDNRRHKLVSPDRSVRGRCRKCKGRGQQ
jgi:hypothetical protein